MGCAFPASDARWHRAIRYIFCKKDVAAIPHPF